MTTSLPPRPAKFTAPSAANLVARPRLFARLDTACRLPLAWIGATPGAGKTSLLASYLQQAVRPCIWIRLDADDARGDRFPELLARAIGSPRPAGRPAATGAQAATTRQALRAALERLPATAALVLDDYDESVAAWLDPWLALLADEVPAGVTVFVAAALEPPTVLARHRADERIATLGNDDLRLDADEGVLGAVGVLDPTLEVLVLPPQRRPDHRAVLGEVVPPPRVVILDDLPQPVGEPGRVLRLGPREPRRDRVDPIVWHDAFPVSAFLRRRLHRGSASG